MKTSGVSCVSVVTSLEAEEPVAALLENIFAESATIYSNLEKMHSVVTVYARSSANALKREEARVRSGLAELKKLGLDTGREELFFRRVKREDWSESWKKYFKTIRVSSALMIKPSWSKEKSKPRQAVVVLDPGLSFGTGQHATTSFCLKEIVRVRPKKGESKTLLDIGSGSGILSISAAKLGFKRVDGFDLDPVTVRVARKNCRSNRVEKTVKIRQKDLTALPHPGQQRYDVVCANLVSTLLISEREKICARLKANGILILAGILATEFDGVKRHYEDKGFRLAHSKIEREWQSGSFK